MIDSFGCRLGTTRNSASLGACALVLMTASLVGCTTDAAHDASAANEVNAGESLESVEDTSDLGGLIRLNGRVGMFEGQTTIALFNRSNPAKPGILHEVTGGGTGYSPFSTELGIGDPLVAGSMLAEPGDCVSVANVGTGGRGGRVTEESAKAKAAFGAFAYAHQSGNGTWSPAWATNGAKVYRTVEECLQDPVRATELGESLTSFEVTSDLGSQIRLGGRVGMFEGQTKIALFNRSKPAKPGIVHEVTGGETGYSIFSTELGLGDPLVPGSMLAEPGDCVSVTNVGTGGRGGTLTEQEAKAKKEFGAFVYGYRAGSGAWRPAWASESPIVFASIDACLNDPSRR